MENYYEQLYASNFDNLEELDKLLKPNQGWIMKK